MDTPLLESIGYTAIIIFFAIIACKLISCFQEKSCNLEDKKGIIKENIKLSNINNSFQKKIIFIGIIGIMFGLLIILADVIFLINMSTYLITNDNILKYFQIDIYIMVIVSLIIMATGLFIFLWTYKITFKRYLIPQNLTEKSD